MPARPTVTFSPWSIVATPTPERGWGNCGRVPGPCNTARHAAIQGYDTLVCEVNVNPLNPVSDAFHAALGSTYVGFTIIHGGGKTVH